MKFAPLFLLFLPAFAHAKKDPMPAALTKVASAANTQSRISLVFDDVHPLYGGVRFELEDGGVLTRLDVPRAGQQPTRTRVRLTDRQADGVVEAIQVAKAWQQVEPPRTPVPDESRATFRVRVGSDESDVWEWANDLTKNDRLIRVQHALNGLLPAGAP